MTDFKMHTRYGYLFYCVKSNHGTNLTELAKATGDGKLYGYTIYAYLPHAIPFGITDNSAEIVPESINLHIHPGQLMEIALSKTVQTALGEPYSDCKETKDYIQINCRDDCFNEKMTEACGCAYPTECGIFYDNVWTEDCKKAFFGKSGSIRSQCSLSCPAECNQVTYATNRVCVKWELEAEHFGNYKTEVSKKHNINGITDDELRKRFSKIHIYFSRLKTTKITQSPSMTLTSLIANMGGFIGKLFI